MGLKIAHHLDRMGMKDTVLKNYGNALHGEDARVCIQQVFLPLAKAYLRHAPEPERLERPFETAAQESLRPHLWLDFRRSVVLARKAESV